MDIDIAEHEVAAVHRGYRERNAAAITEQYAPIAEIFDLAPPLTHPVNAKGIADWLASWGGPVERTPRDIKTTIRGDTAFCHGLIRVSTRRKDKDDAAWWMRVTTCLLRQGGAWKIVHEHTSVPFYMDGSLRAAIDLTP
ncbi:MAG: Ketosteroid isomerase-like enzyme [Rhodospirillales bacterium]|nr:Ketosteroid isomerase-like enzyme [Rhodospirillales bacterium]